MREKVRERRCAREGNRPVSFLGNQGRDLQRGAQQQRGTGGGGRDVSASLPAGATAAAWSGPCCLSGWYRPQRVPEPEERAGDFSCGLL